MPRPVPPPDLSLIERALLPDRRQRIAALVPPSSAVRDYLPWDRLRFKEPPGDLTHEEWWWALRTRRAASARTLSGLLDTTGAPFSFTLPDRLLEDLEAITGAASGRITASEQVTNPATRDRYLVSSLMEEAIRSSQLEGAATTRRIAKEMIRQGRGPRDHSERMILNNYRAMQHIRELRDEPLSPGLVTELHRIVTDGTLRNSEAAGQLQRDDSERVRVWSHTGEILHEPPAVAELPERLERLCRFANSESDDGYVPPVLRAVILHFMMGHDHYFEDGNGRTARAAFYWSMLRQGYWLTEFLTISTILKAAPAQYARAYVLTEQDGGDLTHFCLHQTGVLLRAIDNLHAYLDRKERELSSVRRELATAPGEFNHRQLALVEHARRTPGAFYSIESHRNSHAISIETARQDLMQLESKGLLARSKAGRRFIWSPTPDLERRVTDS